MALSINFHNTYKYETGLHGDVLLQTLLRLVKKYEQQG